jgi:hypothetical protein
VCDVSDALDNCMHLDGSAQEARLRGQWRGIVVASALTVRALVARGAAQNCFAERGCGVPATELSSVNDVVVQCELAVRAALRLRCARVKTAVSRVSTRSGAEPRRHTRPACAHRMAPQRPSAGTLWR